VQLIFQFSFINLYGTVFGYRNNQFSGPRSCDCTARAVKNLKEVRGDRIRVSPPSRQNCINSRPSSPNFFTRLSYLYQTRGFPPSKTSPHLPAPKATKPLAFRFIRTCANPTAPSINWSVFSNAVISLALIGSNALVASNLSRKAANAATVGGKIEKVIDGDLRVLLLVEFNFVL
jgi:hypothetical protein